MSSAPLSLPIKVLVVDDQRAILSGVSALIDSEAPNMRVIGQARCAQQALEMAWGFRPDVVVLDVDLAGEDGLELIPHLHSHARASVVVFTCHTDPLVHQRAMRLGADGFVSKAAPGEELLEVIRGVARVKTPSRP